MPQAAKILIIDDDRVFTATVSALLKQAGYFPLAAHDAMQGFMFAQREGPQVVVLDLQMPAGGGLDLLEKLRRGGRTQAISVIVVTGSPDPQTEAEARAKGADDFLSKPLDNAQFLEVVKSYLE